MSLAIAEGGLADPVFGAQRVFRALMEAMARPGTIHAVGAEAAPPSPLRPVTGAVALALVDQDTPVWLDLEAGEGAAGAQWLGFHAGARTVRNATDAHFAIAVRPDRMPALENFTQGSQDYPDRSATLILQVDTLTAGAPLDLRGPGIETLAQLAPSPLPRHFIQQWQQNNARFPRGVDVILAGPDAIACLPRTTRIASSE
jgi:alpha-D-ribose 1-methylphosphonate 5-triphosphate synthase subunit PhnH